MTSARTRARMVERLREQGIRDEAVLSAMGAVPRHIFVEEALAIRAYDDSPLPIGAGQTISQPYVVARMTELLRAGGDLHARARDRHRMRLPDGGAGAASPTRSTRSSALRRWSPRRGATCGRSRSSNVRIKHGDGSVDLGEDLEVDGIIVTAAATQIPTALLRHLQRRRTHGAAAGRAATTMSAACSG